MVDRGAQFDFLDSKCSSHVSHSYGFILGLIFVYYTTLVSHVQASSSVKCKSQSVASRYQHCGVHPDGVHDLDCFGKHYSRGNMDCVWKPGNNASEKSYTLIIQQHSLSRSRKYCHAFYNITKTSENIDVYENYNMTAEVFEHSESTKCTKAIFRGSPKSLLRCGPPYDASFSRHSGQLGINVSWQQEDKQAVKNYTVRYKAVDSPSWSEPPVPCQNGGKCRVKNVNPSLVYTVQIQCVKNDKCSKCVWSDAYTVPAELTTQPVIVRLEDTVTEKTKGLRLLSLTWKFSAEEPHDGYHVTIGKASGERPRERLNTTQPEIRLILSYSAYHLDISAVNNASTSPAVSLPIPQREDMNGLGAGKLNVTVHDNTSFTIYWQDNLIRKYVCYSVEWMKEGHKAAYMPFYQNKNNYRKLSPLPEALEPYKRYSITLHTRPNKDTCNMKHVNNSESTYGSTNFYYAEGTPVSAPTNISSSNVTLTSAVLHWSSIPEEDTRGFLLGYIIYYSEYHHRGARTERNITVDPTSNSCEVRDLQSGSAYEVQISGFTKAGAGVRSTVCIFKTNYQDYFNYSGLITVFAVMAAVLIFGSPIIKRAKVILWPSIPNPGNSNAMQKIDGPCELELLESINTLRVEEWDTNSLQIVEKEDEIPATSPSTLPLLHASEDEGDSQEMTQSDTEDANGDFSPDITAEPSQHTEVQRTPFVFSSDYTTMEMFQQGVPQGMPANVSVIQPEDADLTVGKSELDYIGQFGTSPTEMPTIL